MEFETDANHIRAEQKSLDQHTKSETLAVYRGLVVTASTSGFALQVTVVDAASPQTPSTFADVTDLQALRQEFWQWCGG